MPTSKPQDHKTTKAAQDAEAQKRFDEIDGHELLKPISQVKGSDQLRLMGQLQALGLFGSDDEEKDSEGVDLDSLDLAAVADLIDYVSEKFALDSSKFEEFTTGTRGYERAMSLAIGYAGELGKDEG